MVRAGALHSAKAPHHNATAAVFHGLTHLSRPQLYHPQNGDTTTTYLRISKKCQWNSEKVWAHGKDPMNASCDRALHCAETEFAWKPEGHKEVSLKPESGLSVGRETLLLLSSHGSCAALAGQKAQKCWETWGSSFPSSQRDTGWRRECRPPWGQH